MEKKGRLDSDPFDWIRDIRMHDQVKIRNIKFLKSIGRGQR
jgi:hypothetical protein